MAARERVPERDALWQQHEREWRDPAQIVSLWEAAAGNADGLLGHRVRGPFWDLLADAKITLLITREYEHLVMALSATDRPDVSFMRLPHPSGLAADHRTGVVHLASTRNPNQVLELRPATHAMSRTDSPSPALDRRPLVPTASRFYPGAMYLHDLALIGGELHGNAVGENAVVAFGEDGRRRRVWWPKAIERSGRPDFSRNYLQLNSIAAGRDLASSWFTASTDRMSARRPGHRNFAVDGRGVLFSGSTREPAAIGLTRPHSARLRRGRVWVDNSGYGELAVLDGAAFATVARLPGWTRGLCFHGDIAYVGVSRVIPRFRQYAPGLDVEHSVCGVFAVDVRSGRVIASLTWPQGNQIFAVEWLPRRVSHGLPFKAGSRGSSASIKQLFYAFAINEMENARR